jgi:hypothetical protein
MKILACMMFLGILAYPAQAQKSVEHVFPSDEEIKLMLSQADRAMTNYGQVVDQEEKLLGASPDVALDKKTLDLWAYAKKALAANTQGFNSVAGFDVVTMLDDASRNSSVIASNAALEVLKAITNGKVSIATDSLVTLFQNANAASTLLYTVSENAVALYTRYLTWQQDTSGQAVQMLHKCSDSLKSRSVKNP